MSTSSARRETSDELQAKIKPEDWIGGCSELNYSVNPHWTAKFDKFSDHPIARGVKPFEINDG